MSCICFITISISRCAVVFVPLQFKPSDVPIFVPFQFQSPHVLYSFHCNFIFRCPVFVPLQFWSSDVLYLFHHNFNLQMSCICSITISIFRCPVFVLSHEHYWSVTISYTLCTFELSRFIGVCIDTYVICQGFFFRNWWVDHMNCKFSDSSYDKSRIKLGFYELALISG